MVKDRGAWHPAVRGVTKSQILRDLATEQPQRPLPVHCAECSACWCQPWQDEVTTDPGGSSPLVSMGPWK